MNIGELFKAIIPTPEEIKTNISSWFKANGKFWGVSVGMHLVIFVVLGVAIGAPQAKKLLQEVVFFDTEVDQAIEEAPITHFDVGETPIEPTVLNTDTLTEPPAATIEQDAQFNDNSADFVEAGGGTLASTTANFGGLGGFDISAAGTGPAVRGPGGVGGGVGESTKGGDGGKGEGFGGRGQGSRQKQLASGGGTQGSEEAVRAATEWLARHQQADGGWGCVDFTKQCKDPSCSAHAKSGANYPMAATAFGLLPFFAAGQTHETKGPYQAVIRKGLFWMTGHQDPKTGRLGDGSMYEHGLATIAICEAYGLSKDQKLRNSAQAAVAFIEEAQNDSSGGWHYGANPPTVGDTSVVGWQLMGLKSAQMAGLKVNPQTLVKSKKFLTSVSKGKDGGLFSYMPESGPTPAMSAVGLLCNQYGGMKRTEPAMIEGMNYVMANLGGAKADSYFLYYATQVMHNLPGPEWDTWNRNARRHLIATQIKRGCAAGSWSPVGHSAGPIMSTSIHALTLEVYYRYLPLYQLENKKQALMKSDE